MQGLVDETHKNVMPTELFAHEYQLLHVLVLLEHQTLKYEQ